MSKTEQLPEQSKYPGEARLYDFDFTALLAEGQTLAAAGNVTATREDATGAVSLVIGGPALQSPRVQVKVSAGLAGEIYRLRATATNSLGEILECDGLLNILA